MFGTKQILDSINRMDVRLVSVDSKVDKIAELQAGLIVTVNSHGKSIANLEERPVRYLRSVGVLVAVLIGIGGIMWKFFSGG